MKAEPDSLVLLDCFSKKLFIVIASHHVRAWPLGKWDEGLVSWVGSRLCALVANESSAGCSRLPAFTWGGRTPCVVDPGLDVQLV